MNTMEAEWKKFHETVYPAGMPEELSRQLRRAFFNGALSLSMLSALPAAQATQLGEEIISACAEYLHCEADKVSGLGSGHAE